MLLSVLVENFKSFKDKTELSMIPSKNVRSSNTQNSDKIKMGDTELLQSAVIFGANASGKSNIIDVLLMMRHCVLKSIPSRVKNYSFRGNSADMDTSFMVRICKNGNIYEYGFVTNLESRVVKAEWISLLDSQKGPRVLFERNIDDKDLTNYKFDYDKKFFVDRDKDRLDVYILDYQKQKTKLFLSEINGDKNFEENSKLHIFSDVYKWFQDDVKIIKPDRPVTDFSIYFQNDAIEKASKLIQTFDTGINEISPCEISFEDFRNEIGSSDADRVLDKITDSLEKKEDGELSISVRRRDGAFYMLTVTGEGGSIIDSLKVTTFKIYHNGIEKPFIFQEESDGTVRVFDLLELLMLDQNKVIIVDELDRSLHPSVVGHYIDTFKRLNENNKNQLIFSTHQPALMDTSLFRKDEIWFVDKNATGGSHLYSLAQFKERNDKNFTKSYFEGRYGALPVLRDIEFKEED